MIETSVLTNLPNRQIKPFDGMPVTAEIWGEAHDEHRKNLQSHDILFHGTGVVTGLVVTANDPPDQYVFISPGLAVDPAGNLIVLAEPVAYDFGSSMEGELYIILGHGEREIAGDQSDIRYLKREFVIAARPGMPKRPAVELGRVNLARRGNAIRNAVNPAHPGIDEIDMRYRAEIGLVEKQNARVGICYLGSKTSPGVITGWDNLTKECKRTTQFNLIVDNDVPITQAISNYSLIYLAGSGTFKTEGSIIKDLALHIEKGRALIIEALDDAAEESFKQVITGLGVSLKPVAENDNILKNPNIFNAPPEGNQGNSIILDKKVIYSNARYSLAWSGKVLGGAGTRSDIRSALEWGINMVAVCL